MDVQVGVLPTPLVLELSNNNKEVEEDTRL